eukprot:TRINITY_DN10650_c0_g1_i4.p1 TRINITY_DN10650_c0_g1~~TRINITY_DN10650_c0_g1_i4.p1  ORF type:complete len:687 (-),score=133.51 TRINITY_DN10650_c0_g1_i4:93-2153(-)
MVYQAVIKNTFFEFSEEDTGKRNERRSLSMGCCPRDQVRSRSKSPPSQGKSNMEASSSSTMGDVVAQLAAAIPRGYSLTLTNHSPSEQTSHGSSVPVPAQGVTNSKSASAMSATRPVPSTVNSTEHAADRQMQNHHPHHAFNYDLHSSGPGADSSSSSVSVSTGSPEFALGSSLALCNYPQSRWPGDAAPLGWNWPPASPMFHPNGAGGLHAAKMFSHVDFQGVSTLAGSIQTNPNAAAGRHAAAPFSHVAAAAFADAAAAKAAMAKAEAAFANAAAAAKAHQFLAMSTMPTKNVAVEAASAVASATAAAVAAKAWQSARFSSEHPCASSTADVGFQSAMTAGCGRKSQGTPHILPEVPPFPWSSASSPQDCREVAKVFATDLGEVEEPSPELEPDKIHEQMDRLKTLLYDGKVTPRVVTPRVDSDYDGGEANLTPPKQPRPVGRDHLMKLLSSPVSSQCLEANKPAYVKVDDESSYLDVEARVVSRRKPRKARNSLNDAKTSAADQVVQYPAHTEFALSKRKCKSKGQKRLCCSILLHMTAPGFDLVPRIIGKSGCNTRSIADATGCKLRVRGRGSGHLEWSTGQEAPVALMLVVTAESGAAEDFRTAVSKSLELMRAVEEDYVKHCRTMRLKATLPGFSLTSESSNEHIATLSGSSAQSLAGQDEAQTKQSKRSGFDAWWRARA